MTKRWGGYNGDIDKIGGKNMKQKIVFLFIILVFGFGGYMVYGQFIQEKPEKEKNEFQKEEDLNQVMKTLQKQVEESQIFKIMSRDYEEFTFTKDNFEKNKDNILAQTLTLLDVEANYESEEIWDVIHIEKLNQHLKQIYGIDGLSTYPNMKIHGTNYEYDANEKKYIARQMYATDADPMGIEPDSIVGSSIVKNEDEYILTLATATIGDGFNGNFDKVYFDRYQTVVSELDTTKLESNSCEQTRCPLMQSEKNRQILTNLLELYVQNQKQNIPYTYQFVFKKNEDGSFYMTRFHTIR